MREHEEEWAALMRRGNAGDDVNIDDFNHRQRTRRGACPASELIAHLQGLPRRQRDVLQSITLESTPIRATATKFAMSEGAVRVALHRGLTNLAGKLPKE